MFFETSPTAAAVVLAAGKGTRMRSDRPKVLFPILGEPMLWYVFEALKPLFGERIHPVVGWRAVQVEETFPEHLGRFIRQAEQLGTGHAVKLALAALPEGITDLLVVNGDTPLAPTRIYEKLLRFSTTQDADLTFLSLDLGVDNAFGRVVRENSQADGRVLGIVEAKDYDPARNGTPSGEVNAGVYVLKRSTMAPLLDLIGAENKSGEYYLTDLVGLAVERGLTVAALKAPGDPELLGINSPRELAKAESILNARLVDALYDNGVLVRFPETVRVGPKVCVNPGAEIVGPCELFGETGVGEGAIVHSHVVLQDVKIGARSVVKHHCHLEGTVVGEDCRIGPFARLRLETVLKDHVHIGNFVEAKKSVLRSGVKAGHLSYLGDADVGERTNVGAGTITCNYDGRSKSKTVIGEGCFIGSDAALVAPVTLGKGVFVGAGSVVTEDVPDDKLVIARSRQVIKDRKKRP